MRRLLLLFLFVLTACGTPVAAAEKPAPRPTEVGVVTLVARDVTLTRDLPGRVVARRVAEVRARVNGIVEKRLFEEGSDVKEGQSLYRIESAPYEASLAAARASLARAEANLVNARQLAERNEALLGSNTVSQEAVDQASAALKAAEADAAAGRASVKTARITRQYALVNAPVSGRIGRSVVTEGAYVQQAGATLMATIQQIDSVYVDIAQSSADLLQLRRDLAEHKLERAGGDARVRLMLEDGTLYGEPGTLQFADVTVDPGTGSVSLRALFPNPRGELLPGMFVRARIEEGVQQNAILVPQRGVTRDAKGQAIAMVVTADKKVERRALVAARAVDNAWLVTEGLVAGDQVIVDGLQKIRPGAEVVPVPAADLRPEAKPADPATPPAAPPADPVKSTVDAAKK